MKYLAIKINGDIYIMNDTDELGGLNDFNVKHEVIGRVCDSVEFGDNCSTDCLLYRCGTCPSEIVRDFAGQLWHVLKY